VTTPLAPARPGSVTPFPVDRQAWSAWLTENTDPQWRPDEWDAENWIFTGDPGNPATAIWRCDSAGCHVAVRASRHLCRTCYEQFLESGLNREEFAQVGRKALVRSMPGERDLCSVTDGESRCQREMSTRGACIPHYVKWRYQARVGRTTLELEDWLATRTDPMSPGKPCLIGGCKGNAPGRVDLCTYHRDRWARHRRAHKLGKGTREGMLAWAAVESPWLTGYQFTLKPLPPLLRQEVLYGLTQRDSLRPTLSPVAGRLLVRGLDGVDSLVSGPSVQLADYGYLDRNCEAHWSDVLRLVRAGFDQFRGVDPLDKPSWDLMQIGLTGRTQNGTRRNSGEVDSTEIRQEWLRRLLAEWIKETSPNSTDFRRTFEACRTASEALLRRPSGGHDPSALKVTDMDAVLEAIKRRLRKDGGTLAYQSKAEFLRHFCQLLDFSRRLDIVQTLAPGFARQSYHKIPYEDPGEDMAGKAIPELVVAQLDAAIDRMGADFPYGKHDPEKVQLMLQTVYILLRDTGRRPWEIRWLRTDCLDSDDGEYVLIWDNHKARRNRRRLEIGRETAFAIQRWLKVRATLKVPARSRTFLFPTASPHAADACIDSETVARALRRWVDELPELDSDVVGEDGSPLPFDRSKIFAYAFRHTYAQRHADAGTDIHVLKDLMDHRSIDTTMGYFKVSQKRRREAVELMRMHVVDREGNVKPTASGLAYEARSVAVPFGNCVEPSNVKAGGKKCPIRFQCSGCGFYRPDLSCLVTREEHIRELKADRETAIDLFSAEFVIRNLTDEILSFEAVVASIRKKLATMPEAERRQIEEAGTVLRKVRASAPSPVIPVPKVPARRQP